MEPAPSFLKRYRSAAVCVLLAAATLASFWPVLHHGFINYDDKEYVTENPWVQAGITWRGLKWAFSSFFAGNWHPLTWVSHMVDCQVYGLSPIGHHLTNLLLHIVNSLLLFRLLFRLTLCFWQSGVVAGLFALHPLHVESVAWVAERKDVLSTCFLLLSLLAYEAYAGRLACSRNRSGQLASPYYALSLSLFAFGLLCKPMLVTLPFLLLLLDFWPLQRFENGPPSLTNRVPLFLEKVPFVALSLASSVITWFAQRRGGALYELSALPFSDRLGNAFVSYARYVAKTLWPARLAPFYPHPGTWPVWLVMVSIAALVAATVFALARARKFSFLAVGWFWFLVTLFPVIGLIQVGSQAMADRYMYIPSIGLFIASVWGGAELLNLIGRRAYPALAAVLSLAMLSVCGFLARIQVGYWKDSVTLFARALAVTPENFMSHFYLGNALLEAGQFRPGMEHLERAATLNPRFPNAHTSLAYAFATQGDFERAVAEYRCALNLRPNFPDALNNLAWMLATCADPRIRNGVEAVVLAKRACAQCSDPPAQYLGTLAAAYAEAGQFQEAIDTAEKAAQVADVSGQTKLSTINRQLLALYREHKPYHDSSKP